MTAEPTQAGTSVAEDLYSAFLLEHPDAPLGPFEDWCARHAAHAGELRDLHAAYLALAGDASAARPLLPEVEGFRCLRMLGRGGMGEVWEALDERLERKVALKLQRSGWTGGERDAERWRREVAAAARLHHPNIVALHSAGESSGRCFLVQELVPGGRTLRDEIEELRRGGQLPADHERRVAARFAKLADALQHAHDAGVLHRDVKPQNVLLERDGTPKLADFGLARLSGDVTVSRTGEFVGTYFYASPEQVSGGRAVGPAADVFGLGASLFECLTLERPFSGDSAQAVTWSILHEDPPDARTLRPRVPRDLATICAKALEKKVDRRYASCAELRDDLLRFLGDEPIAARPPSALRRSQKWTARHPTAATALALTSVAFAVIVALLLEARDRGDQLAAANAALRTANTDLVAARDLARSEADTSREVEDFLANMFRAADPSLFGRGTPDLRALVERGTARLRAGGIADPRVRARLAGRLGELQERLGGFAVARELLDGAVALFETLGQASTREGRWTRAMLANVLVDLGDFPAAEELLAGLASDGAVDDPEIELQVLGVRARVGLRAGRLDEVAELLERSEPLLPSLGEDAAFERVAHDVSEGELHTRRGDLVAAENVLSGACATLEPLLEAGNTYALDAFNTLGLLRAAQGRNAEAAEVFARLLPIVEERLGRDHPRAFSLRTSLAGSCLQLGRFEDAATLLEDVVERSRRVLGADAEETLVALTNLGSVLTGLRRLEDAERVLRDAERGMLLKYGERHLETAMTRSALAIVLFHRGRADEAAELQARALRSVDGDFHERPMMEGALSLYRRTAGLPPEG